VNGICMRAVKLVIRTFGEFGEVRGGETGGWLCVQVAEEERVS